jgi:hypothetical protein
MSELELRLLTVEQLEEVYHRHMKRDFPAAELKPLSILRRLMDSGCYDPYGVFQGDTLVGYAFFWTAAESPFALLDYLAVVSEQRNNGLGQVILGELTARFCQGDRGFFCEAEAPVSGCPATDSLRQRRLNFYLRCGGRLAEYGSRVFTVPYRVLSWGPPVEERVLMKYHQLIYQTSIPKQMYEENIVIPEVFP